jgi:hypothetical protein
VHDLTVIPHHDIVQSPFVHVDEFRLGGVLGEIARQQPGLYDSAANAGGHGYVVSRNLQATFIDPHLLRPLGRAAREHSQSQIRKIAGSLTHYGFRMPMFVDAQRRVVAGGTGACRDRDYAKFP